MSNRICSYFARFKSGPSASEYMEVDRKAERSVNLEMSGLVLGSIFIMKVRNIALNKKDNKFVNL